MLTAEFIKAGKAVFTISNSVKGEHYTFKVCKVKDKYFVKLRKDEDYTYMGMMINTKTPLQIKSSIGMKIESTITMEVIPTIASKLKADSKPFLVFNWVMKIICYGVELPAGYKLQHEGKCGKCGRPLTNPQSLETGLGPVCSGVSK